MIALLRLLLALLVTPFRSKSALEAENAALRQQIIVLRRKLRGRVRLSNDDRLFFVWLYRLFPSIARAMLIIRPDTLVRWSIDLFVVPTIGFGLLYGLVIVRIARRNLVWINVTAHPTAEWVARQLVEAFPWQEAPRHLLRDRDAVYGSVFLKRLRVLGIRDHPIAPRSPWQNPHAERLIGSIRRECLDRIVVTNEAHLRSILRRYAYYYNRARTHRSLSKDCPIHRPIQTTGEILSTPVLGGLHHFYARP